MYTYIYLGSMFHVHVHVYIGTSSIIQHIRHISSLVPAAGETSAFKFLFYDCITVDIIIGGRDMDADAP